MLRKQSADLPELCPPQRRSRSGRRHAGSTWGSRFALICFHEWPVSNLLRKIGIDWRGLRRMKRHPIRLFILFLVGAVPFHATRAPAQAVSGPIPSTMAECEDTAGLLHLVI